MKVGEQALKRIPARNKAVTIDDDEDADMAEETALYAFFQTEVYKPPPVVKGRIPKNAYGNLDVYVPSMVPPGGVHIPHVEAARAARTLGIDYADAVTGFNFKGRHGTAVFNGVVVASEFREAVVEVIRCFEDEKLQDEEEHRAAEVLRSWKHFLLKLRIADRVKGYAVEGAADEEDSVGIERSDVEEISGSFLPESDEEMANAPEQMGLRDAHIPAGEMAGGFLPESDDDDDDGGGSTLDDLDRLHSNTKGKDPVISESNGLTGGGFIPDTPYQFPKLNHSPKASRPKYSLIVVPRQAPDNTTADGKPDSSTQSWLHERITPGASAAAAISVASSVNDSAPASAYASVTPEPSIVVDSSVNDSASLSVEMLSRAPSQAQSRAPSESVEVVSPQSEENEGSLLSEDPEDEDAVPEWLMSD
jgi:xeroderma pigmentosum group C-complementing protein